MSKKRTTKRAGKKARLNAPHAACGTIHDSAAVSQKNRRLRWCPACDEVYVAPGHKIVPITPADAPDYERVVRGIDRLRRWVAKELKECKKLGVPCSISGESMLEELTRLTAAQRQKGTRS
jgi:hypothetical protein